LTYHKILKAIKGSLLKEAHKIICVLFETFVASIKITIFVFLVLFDTGLDESKAVEILVSSNSEKYSMFMEGKPLS
jgi:hypothetical protein